MKNVVEIKNLSFKYDQELIFDHLNLTVAKNKFTTILGTSGSGKTTLVKLLMGELTGDRVVILNGIAVTPDNLKQLYSTVGTVFENQNDIFIFKTVLEELAFPLENKSYSPKQIDEKIGTLCDDFNIKHLLHQNPNMLTASDKELVNLLMALIKNPQLLIIDEGLKSLDKKTKEKVINILKEKIKNKELTVLYFTHNVEDSLYSDDIIILDNKNVLDYGSKEEIYQNEDLFNTAHLELPFIVDLSKKLQFYNMIDHDYFSMEKMVNDLWK